jgi:hypothetical protein
MDVTNRVWKAYSSPFVYAYQTIDKNQPFGVSSPTTKAFGPGGPSFAFSFFFLNFFARLVVGLADIYRSRRRQWELVGVGSVNYADKTSFVRSSDTAAFSLIFATVRAAAELESSRTLNGGRDLGSAIELRAEKMPTHPRSISSCQRSVYYKILYRTQCSKASTHPTGVPLSAPFSTILGPPCRGSLFTSVAAGGARVIIPSFDRL